MRDNLNIERWYQERQELEQGSNVLRSAVILMVAMGLAGVLLLWSLS